MPLKHIDRPVNFPSKNVGVIFPYRKHNAEFKNEADFCYKTSLETLEKHIMPRVIERENKSPIVCPSEWIKE